MHTEFPLTADGVWCEVIPDALRGGPALFLDRDGVIVEEVGYLCRVEDIAIIPRSAATIAQANRRGIPVVVVTNQAGIGRGYYGWDAFARVQHAIISALAKSGARIDAVYGCPHHATGVGALAVADHPSRKPNAGMVLSAAAALRLDLERSWLVGDKASDIECARRAGLAGALHVLTGHGESERAAALMLATPIFDVRLGQSIGDAVGLPIFSTAMSTARLPPQ